MVKSIVHAVKKFFGSKEKCADECCKDERAEEACNCCEPVVAKRRKTAKKAKKKGKKR
ncbi:MAG: hypothetical protein WCT31_01030 [Candidatus Micrarchaeia archaeon]